jgi:hypothetical protein
MFLSVPLFSVTHCCQLFAVHVVCIPCILSTCPPDGTVLSLGSVHIAAYGNHSGHVFIMFHFVANCKYWFDIVSDVFMTVQLKLICEWCNGMHTDGSIEHLSAAVGIMWIVLMELQYCISGSCPVKFHFLTWSVILVWGTNIIKAC